ncbi:hypothetical protein B0H10DRAFT_2242666 [Mycena sp. CBHHK59/15]|nr:hypothetical protein B0H10DRAFT_2242666 [Mycena sp. CBHHK59/15]
MYPHPPTLILPGPTWTEAPHAHPPLLITHVRLPRLTGLSNYHLKAHFTISTAVPIAPNLDMTPFEREPKYPASSFTPSPSEAYCRGCKSRLANIEKHLLKVGPTSVCGKKRTYQLYVDKVKQAELVRFEYPVGYVPAAHAANGPKGERHHRCVDCKIQFADIRDHFEHPDCGCKTTKFRIRNPSISADRFGAIVDYAEWLLKAPALDPDRLMAKRPRGTRAPIAPAPKPHMCYCCGRVFPHIAEHFRTLRASSKCDRRMFREKEETGWSNPIAYDTWPGNPLTASTNQLSPA